MHPLAPGGDAFANSHRHDDKDATPMPSATQQMTYFLASEESVNSPESSTHSSSHHLRSQGQSKSAIFGVESLETSANYDRDSLHKTLQRSSFSGSRNVARPSSRRSEDGSVADSMSSSSHSSPHATRDSSPAGQRQCSTTKNNISQTGTPLSLPSPTACNIPSFLNSRRSSAESLFTDEASSQAILSSNEEDKEPSSSQVMDSGIIPQLVMPSIKMPSRRPFTDRGKNMGRLKVLIAGDAGVGKTSLIKAIVQICPDIVHVDPLTSTPIEIRPKRKMSRARTNLDDNSTQHIAEVHASTKPYPSWWSEVDDTNILRRRKSIGGTVLERNLCFVDTPGYGRGISCMETITPVIDYIEMQFKKVSTVAGLTDGELLNMICGNGGSQVDVVFYTIRHRIKPVDIEYMRRLSHLTNVIPIITKSDTLPAADIETLKSSIICELENASVPIFFFGKKQASIYAISTVASQDNMDASLMMSPDYVQPLVPTDLVDLVSDVFQQDAICFLRHSAAMKFLKWQKVAVKTSHRSQINFTPSLSLGGSVSSLSSGNSRGTLLSPIGTAPTYTLARITDHTRREEHLAQVRLSNWAHDLQQSLQNERARYEALCKGERAIWLTERLGECVRDGTLVPAGSSTSGPLVRQSEKSDERTYWRPKTNRAKSDRVSRSDPLGLLSFNARVKRSSWVALQVVGGLGVVGGFLYWCGVGKNWFGLSDETRAGIWQELEKWGWGKW